MLILLIFLIMLKRVLDRTKNLGHVYIHKYYLGVLTIFFATSYHQLSRPPLHMKIIHKIELKHVKIIMN